MSDHGYSFTTVVAAAAIGLVAGLLTAPQSGEQTRGQLRARVVGVKGHAVEERVVASPIGSTDQSEPVEEDATTAETE